MGEERKMRSGKAPRGTRSSETRQEVWAMSKEGPVHIVGAGLAGLTAAVILAKRGREVIVYEKGNRVGGLPIYNPSPHGTPLDVDRMNGYLGFDLRPGLVDLTDGVISVWGKRYNIKFPPIARSELV
jgi:hypothetical protein